MFPLSPSPGEGLGSEECADATPDDVLPPRRVGGDGSTGFAAPVSAERWREEVERAAGRLEELAASTVGQW